jgi:hypothetical protein
MTGWVPTVNPDGIILERASRVFFVSSFAPDAVLPAVFFFDDDLDADFLDDAPAVPVFFCIFL